LGWIDLTRRHDPEAVLVASPEWSRRIPCAGTARARSRDLMQTEDDVTSRWMILTIIAIAFLMLFAWVSNDVDRTTAMAPDIVVPVR
jgi:hypothetical protein